MTEASLSRELALPGATFLALRRSLRTEVGPLSTVHALQAAGYETGEAMARDLLGSILGEDGPLERSTEGFWSEFQAFFSRRGWGTLEHRSPHPAIGLLASEDWIEAQDAGGERQPSCSFTTGLLSSLLTRTAGGAIGVLEIRCRSRGDRECAFAFGSDATVHEVYGSLLEGTDFEDVLSGL